MRTVGRGMLFTALVAVAIAALNVLPSAFAVTATTPATTLSNTYTSESATYAFSGFTLAGNQLCERVDIAFPAGTNVNEATLVSPAGTLTTSTGTVSIVFSPLIPKGSAITVQVGGIVNPPDPLTNASAALTFYTALNKKGPFTAEPPLTSGAYSSTVRPSLSMSIDTTDIAFTLVPGASPASQTVSVSVASSTTYDIGRTLNGQWADINLDVSGDASGTFGPGTRVHQDVCSAWVSYDATGGASYSASILYTVLGQ